MTDARSLTLALGGKWYGHYGSAPCPVCQPDGHKGQNALTLADGGARLLANCKKSGCDFRDILAASGVGSGDYTPPDAAELERREAQELADQEKKARQAIACWKEAQPIRGTIAETYLRTRGITCPLPDMLRFHPDCWHPSARRLPAMVALIEGSGLLAVHRTYLRSDGSAKADIDSAKAMLGRTRGGAVRLSAGPGPLVVGEGIETCLSLACGLLPGHGAIWAALSTSGMAGLTLPIRAGEMTVAYDGDEPGRDAALKLAARAHGLGWRVKTFAAPDGHDWNDVLQQAECAA